MAAREFLILFEVTTRSVLSWRDLLPGLLMAVPALLVLRWFRPRTRRTATLTGVLVGGLAFAAILIFIETKTGTRLSGPNAVRYLLMPFGVTLLLLPGILPAAWVLQQFAFRRS